MVLKIYAQFHVTSNHKRFYEFWILRSLKSINKMAGSYDEGRENLGGPLRLYKVFSVYLGGLYNIALFLFIANASPTLEPQNRIGPKPIE